MDVKRRIGEWVNIDHGALHEISLEDIELADYAQENLDSVMMELVWDDMECGELLYKSEAIPCKSYWIEDSLELLVCLWNDIQTKAVMVPREGWMLRADITIH